MIGDSKKATHILKDTFTSDPQRDDTTHSLRSQVSSLKAGFTSKWSQEQSSHTCTQKQNVSFNGHTIIQGKICF